jgi:hypothetical protein
MPELCSIEIGRTKWSGICYTPAEFLSLKPSVSIPAYRGLIIDYTYPAFCAVAGLLQYSDIAFISEDFVVVDISRRVPEGATTQSNVLARYALITNSGELVNVNTNMPVIIDLGLTELLSRGDTDINNTVKASIQSALQTVLSATPSNPAPSGASYTADGVYFDPVAGSAGVSESNGTASNPVNNVTDAMALMANRNVHKLYLVGGRSFGGYYSPAITSPDVMTDINSNPFKPNSLIGLKIRNGTDASEGIITANTEHTITAILSGGTNNFWSTNDPYFIVDPRPSILSVNNPDNQPYYICFDKNIDLELVGNRFYDITVGNEVTVHFIGDVICANLFLEGNSSSIFVYGNVYCTSVTNESASGNVIIKGNCYSSNGGVLNSSVGNITIFGNCQIASGAVLNGVAGTLVIWGNLDTGGGELYNSNTGTITIYGNCNTGGGNINNTSGGNIFIKGNLDVGSSTVENTGSVLTYNGNIVPTSSSTTAEWQTAEVDHNLCKIGIAGNTIRINALIIDIGNLFGNVRIRCGIKSLDKTVTRSVDGGEILYLQNLTLREVLTVTIDSDGVNANDSDNGKSVGYVYY